MSARDDLSPSMKKLLDLMEPGKTETISSIEERYYGLKKGSYGYVNRGRGASLRGTFDALERRGLLVRDATRGGWRLP